jgi:hypothetical protein
MESKLFSKKYISFLFICYLAIFITYGFIVFFVFRDGKFEIAQAGLFGDMFGAINAFFTGLAFFGVAITIYLQMKENERSKQAFQLSQFESTFFNLVSILHQVIASSKKLKKVDGETISIEGSHYFHYAFSQFIEQYSKDVLLKKNDLFGRYLGEEIAKGTDHDLALKNYQPDLNKIKPWLIEAYETFYESHEENLGHYYRFVYNIIKHIKDMFPNDRSIQDKYIGLLQAQMSNDELGLLFYNCLSKHGLNSNGKSLFKEWLDSHNFFENIDERCVFDRAFVNFYPSTNFKFMKQ